MSRRKSRVKRHPALNVPRVFGDKALPLFFLRKKIHRDTCSKNRNTPSLFLEPVSWVNAPLAGQRAKPSSRVSREKSFSCLVTKIPSSVFQCKQTFQQKVLQQKSSAERESRRPRCKRVCACKKKTMPLLEKIAAIIRRVQTLDFALFLGLDCGTRRPPDVVSLPPTPNRGLYTRAIREP